MTAWAGTEPLDRDGHEGCECLLCSPPCAVEGCWSFDVTGRLVNIGRGRWVRLLLCDFHGVGEHQGAPFTLGVVEPGRHAPA